MNDPFATGQRRIAILGGRQMIVRLVQPAPENAPAWICALEPDHGDLAFASGAMFLIGTKDLRELLPDDSGDEAESPP